MKSRVHAAALALVLVLTACGSSGSGSDQQGDTSAQGADGAGSGKLDAAAIAEIQTGIENGTITDRGAATTSRPGRPTTMKLHCQGNGVVAFEADVLPVFAAGGVVYFRDKKQWAATGNHVLTGVELCRGDKTADGVPAGQVEELKQQVRSGVDVDGDMTVLEDVVFSGTWTNPSGTERLIFVGYSPKLGMMDTVRYVPSQSRWASV
jgi:hypothetical protein